MRRNKFNSNRKFERLEDRWMMAADINLDDGVLTVQGTDGHDYIAVALDSDDPERLRVMVADYTTGAVLAESEFDVEDVEEIVANGLNGNDQMANYTDIRSKFFGGAGDDILFGGGGNDLLDGGANNDTLLGRTGNDELTGGVGNDQYVFWGGPEGSDVINENASIDTDTLDFRSLGTGVNVNLAITSAQAVNTTLTLQLTSATGIESVKGTDFADTIRGNSRNNSLFGFGGDDDLFGGAGVDSLYGGNGNDDLFGEAGNDWLYGEAGLDNFNGGADNDFLDGGQDGKVDNLTGGSGQDTFVKYKKRLMPYFDYEQKVLDYNSAVDIVLTRYY